MVAGRWRGGKAAQAALPLHPGRCIPAGSGCSTSSRFPGTCGPTGYSAATAMAGVPAAVLAGQQSSRVTGGPPRLQAILQAAEDLFHLVQRSQETSTLLQQELMQGSGLGPRLSVWEMASASCPCVCRSCCSPDISVRPCSARILGAACWLTRLTWWGCQACWERKRWESMVWLWAASSSSCRPWTTRGGWLCWAAELLDAHLDL